MGFGLRDFDLRGGRAAFEAGSLVDDLGSGVWVSRVGVSKFGRGLWFGVQGPGAWVQGSEFRAQGSGFRGLDVELIAPSEQAAPGLRLDAMLHRPICFAQGNPYIILST